MSLISDAIINFINYFEYAFSDEEIVIPESYENVRETVGKDPYEPKWGNTHYPPSPRISRDWMNK